MVAKLDIGLLALRRSVFWTAFVSLVLVAQFSLAVHQTDHHLHPDIAAIADDCIACQFVSAIVGGPSTSAALPPIGLELGAISPRGQDVLHLEDSPSDFQSRAPPPSVSA
jgi:hypothetical protein